MHPFNRYYNATDSTIKRMPVSKISTKTSPRTLSELICQFEKYSQDAGHYKSKYPWATRFVMGFPLPEFQRPSVWSVYQQIKFITSLWLDIDVGSYLTNEYYDFVNSGSEIYTENSDILLDGQQRLTAIQDYLLGIFPVPDANDVPTYWYELSKIERRFFGNKTFSRSTVNTSDEKLLREIYDLRSFGGTMHTEDQRASS